MKPKEGRISWVCGLGLFADTENYHHAHEYVDSWASKEAAEFLLAYYYYGHTNTTANLDVVLRGRADGARPRRPDGARRTERRTRRPSSRGGASTSSTGARCRRRDPATWPALAHDGSAGGGRRRSDVAPPGSPDDRGPPRRADALAAAVLRDPGRVRRRLQLRSRPPVPDGHGDRVALELGAAPHGRLRLHEPVLEVDPHVARGLDRRRAARLPHRLLPRDVRRPPQVRAAPADHRAVPHELPAPRAGLEGDPGRRGRDQLLPRVDRRHGPARSSGCSTAASR